MYCRHYFRKICNTWYAVLLMLLSNCIAFNEQETDEGIPIGVSSMELDLRFPVIRRQESVIGNLVADAILKVSQERCRRANAATCPHFSLINMGAIRQQFHFSVREKIPPGNIYRADIEQLLPFSNQLVVVRLLGRDIKLALEHAVSKIANGYENSNAPYFMAASGLAFSVDCSKPSQVLSTDGTQILQAGDRISDIYMNVENGKELLERGKKYNVVMTSYMAQGNDGFLAFVQRDQHNRAIRNQVSFLPKYHPTKDIIRNDQGEPLIYGDSVIDWISSHTLQGKMLTPPKSGRIMLQANCRY